MLFATKEIAVAVASVSINTPKINIDMGSMAALRKAILAIEKASKSGMAALREAVLAAEKDRNILDIASPKVTCKIPKPPI